MKFGSSVCCVAKSCHPT